MQRARPAPSTLLLPRWLPRAFFALISGSNRHAHFVNTFPRAR